MCSAPKELRRINKAEFMQTALALINYGTIHSVKVPGQADSIVFVKKPPSQLTKDTDTVMGNLKEYTKRYLCATPSSVGPSIRMQVVKLGLVTKEDLKGVPEGEQDLQDLFSKQ